MALFGGVVKRVVLDNMSAAIVRADAKDPGINPSFAEYAQARGFFVDPARVRHPQDKARVENQVPYVRERWFAGESFSDDLAMLRESAERWCIEVAGARIHGTTRRVPREVFEVEERAHLGPAPAVDGFVMPREFGAEKWLWGAVFGAGVSRASWIAKRTWSPRVPWPL